ncbi:tyrosine-type recombinase/integrase [Antarctobacter sp.]|uniref:tyrosine-type recombinase/integrase n=1 Tax=Antarctobacter sp. TaxID=1872577 RepID=UPI003A93BFD8
MAGSIKLRLTKSSIVKLEARDKRYKVLDDELPGFFLVVTPNGRKSFYLRYRVGGGRGGTLREPKIGDAASMTPEQARRIAREWHAEVRLGGDPGGDRVTKRDAPDVSHLMDRYLQDHARLHKKPSSIKNDTALIENSVRPALGSKKVSEITRADIMQIHNSMQRTPYQANRALALLSKAFGLAEYWGLRPDGSNPTLHVKKFKEKPRERYLSEDEAKRLSNVLDLAERQGWLPNEAESGASKRRPISCFVVAAIKLLMFTGARHGEILTLKWDWVDLVNRQLSLPDSKTGKKTI